MKQTPYFERFSALDIEAFTRAQRDAYEQSVMDYIGVREVAVTAAEEKEQELIISMHLNGLELERIALISKLPILRVKDIIDAYERSLQS